MSDTKKTPLQRPFYVRIPQDLDKPFIPRQEPSDVPPQRIFEEPLTCPIRINKSWLEHLFGAFEVLNVSDTWIGTETQVFNTLQDVELLMRLLANGYCEEGDMIQFRQNPDNPCQLQQSLDDGATWSLAFDYELCYEKVGSKPTPLETLELMEEGYQVIGAIDTQITNEGLEGVYPEAVFEQPTDPQAQLKNDALCWTLNEWNRLYAGMLESMSANPADPVPPLEVATEAASKVFASTVQLAVTTLWSGGNPYVVGAAGGHFLYAIGSNWDLFWQQLGNLKDQIFGTTQETPPIDIPQSWIDRISCEMYQNMRDNTLTEASFQASLSGVSANNVQEQIYLILWGMQVALHQNWLVLLDMYQKYHTLAGIKDVPYACDTCLDYCFPLFHQYLYIADLPEKTQFWREYPVPSTPVENTYQPNQNQNYFFGQNQGGRFWLEYTPDQPCSLGVSATWMRGNQNSAACSIQTYTTAGGWVTRASQNLTVGGTANQPTKITWTNPTLETWEKVKVLVTTSAPRINIFELIDNG